jgi:hypothetical protein
MGRQRELWGGRGSRLGFRLGSSRSGFIPGARRNRGTFLSEAIRGNGCQEVPFQDSDTSSILSSSGTSVCEQCRVEWFQARLGRVHVSSVG